MEAGGRGYRRYPRRLRRPHGNVATAADPRVPPELWVRRTARRARREVAPVTVVLVALAGLVGGVLAGLFGVGGGIVFVPVLTLGLGLTQLHAEATSLLAIV